MGESQRSYTCYAHLVAGKNTLQMLHHGALYIACTVSGLAHDELGPRGYKEALEALVGHTCSLLLY